MLAAEAEIADWVNLIRAEYLEIPDLRLTKRQVRRLWGLDDQIADTILSCLVDARFLRRTHQAAYVRVDAGGAN